MLTNIKKTYNEYPRNFWVLMLGVFIDRFGGALVYPFFALYITDHFDVGMTEVGYLFGIFTLTGIIGSFLGGALTDKFGRKNMMLLGLFISGMTSLMIIFVNDIRLFYSVGAVMGLLGNIGGPAAQAMIADILPEEQRTEGYGIFRVTFNLSVTFGPLLGGLFADYNFALLFIGDAITSAITAYIVWKFIPESKPVVEGQEEESLAKSVGGYGRVARDYPFMIFLLVSMLSAAVYMQMNTTLSVYMRDVHDFPNKYYGYILAMNAGMVVTMQFWITRRIKGFPAMKLMAVGTFLYGIGFGMFGIVQGIAMFALAMVILTIGEMVIAPVSQTLVAKFAPEDMRGRYMAMFGFSWAVPSLFVPLLAGVVMDNYNPNWIWYAAFFIDVIAGLGYNALHDQTQKREDQAMLAAEPVMAEGSV